MNRLDSVEDVLDLVRRCRLVEDIRLNGFVERLGGASPLTPAAVFELLVERGLLTPYQSNELAAGRCELAIGGYRILDLLGRGGMGQVFLAEHPLLKKRVALKVLTDGNRTDAAARERFVREARAAAALDHPNIVRVFSVNDAHDPPYLVMEYVDGISLQAAVVRHGTFTPSEAAAVGVEVALGLQCIAAVGLVHRDIKPANILIDRHGGVKILDLGIARFTADPLSKLIDTHDVVGTLDYLAPEQALDSSRVDARADLYSLGATLFFLLAGHPPYADDEVDRKAIRKQHSNPPSIAAQRLDIPPGLAEVINRLQERSAVDRYATPAEAAEALKPWASPGEDFPERYFRPWNSPVVADESNVSGNEPSPTPLPPTRRILRSQTERIIALPDTLPKTTPMPPIAALADSDPDLDESGSPTENIVGALPAQKSWPILALFAVGTVAALAGWFGS